MGIAADATNHEAQDLPTVSSLGQVWNFRQYVVDDDRSELQRGEVSVPCSLSDRIIEGLRQNAVVAALGCTLHVDVVRTARFSVGDEAGGLDERWGSFGRFQMDEHTRIHAPGVERRYQYRSSRFAGGTQLLAQVVHDLGGQELSECGEQVDGLQLCSDLPERGSVFAAADRCFLACDGTPADATVMQQIGDALFEAGLQFVGVILGVGGVADDGQDARVGIDPEIERPVLIRVFPVGSTCNGGLHDAPSIRASVVGVSKRPSKYTLFLWCWQVCAV